MEKYDLEWIIRFDCMIGIDVTDTIDKIVKSINAEFIGKELTATLYETISYKTNRSLDIILPILLTDFDLVGTEIYRDNSKNVFVIEVNL